MEGFHDNQSSVAELDRLYKELQLRNKLNQEQNSKLQQQRDSLNKRNMEVAAMDKRITELRDRLYKKKAALQQKENVPNGFPGRERAAKDSHLQLPSEGQSGQQSGPSRVAAVGPYIQSSTMPRGPVRSDLLVKPAYPDGTATLPTHDLQAKTGTGSSKLGEWSPSGPDSNSISSHGSSSTLPRMPSTATPAQNRSPSKPVKVPPPVPTKPKGPAVIPYGKPALHTGTFPKTKSHSQQQQPHSGPGRSPLTPSQSQTLPLPSKQDTPPAATVRPFTPELPKDNRLGKPQTLDANSIYSMYTQQSGIQGALNRAQNRTNGFASMYGKPVISGSQQYPENPYLERRSPTENEVDHNSSSSSNTTPSQPTKLLPFISNPYRHQSDGDLEALRKKLYNAPRPLKKRSSITEPEGPAGPNIQKLLYQKTTLAAMETTVTPTTPALRSIPKRSPRPEDVAFPPPPPSADGEEDFQVQVPSMPPPPPPPEGFLEEFPPYPPPPYPSGAEQDSLSEENMKAPEVTGQVTLPPGKRTNLRKVGSERIDHGMRVKFNPLALLLDSSLEGEFDLVQRIIYEVEDPSQPNDEGITALHNAVCAGHTEIVKFLVQFGSMSTRRTATAGRLFTARPPVTTCRCTGEDGHYERGVVYGLWTTAVRIQMSSPSERETV
ncbi:hypothetical protein WMY93_018163 [Mugilogobius chulae]|uniref:Uncharacterized protein n=1 Tax=Mugilogobius chulae TaxID=88201 RepID=A0AAW0NPH9_9GOBI